MPEILIDILKTKDQYSGLGQFSANFEEAIVRRPRSEYRLAFLAPTGHRPVATGNVRYVRPTLGRRFFRTLNSASDLWHSLHQFPAFKPAVGKKWVLTVHDLNFLVEKTPGKAKRYLERLQRNIDEAAAVTTISHFTRDELERHIDLRGRSVTVIHNGVCLPSLDPGQHTGRPYFLSLGVFKEKKNFHSLLPLMEHFPEHDLVLAGNNHTPYGEQVRAQVRESGLGDRVHLPGAVDDQEKVRLYAHCDAFLFPSLAEGFGLPVIEAMLLGKPVFLSRSTSLPEIGGGAAFYFDDLGSNAMARSMMQGLKAFNAQPGQYGERVKRHAYQFSWEACMEKYVTLYSEVLSR